MLLNERLSTFKLVNLARVGSKDEMNLLWMFKDLKKFRMYSSVLKSGTTPNCLIIPASSTASGDLYVK